MGLIYLLPFFILQACEFNNFMPEQYFLSIKLESLAIGVER
jgi:hypothetical protein